MFCSKLKKEEKKLYKRILKNIETSVTFADICNCRAWVSSGQRDLSFKSVERLEKHAQVRERILIEKWAKKSGVFYETV